MNQGIATTSQTVTVGRVYLELFEVTVPTTIDQIVISNAATIAGNFTVGIYGPVVTEETADGAPLAATSASTAHAGANVGQAISLTSAVTLSPGRYYVAVEGSDVTATLNRNSGTEQVAGWKSYYDRGGGYGALTTPCPATTTGGNAQPFGVRLRSTGA